MCENTFMSIASGNTLTATVTAFADVVATASHVQALSDDALLEATGLLASARRDLDACAGWVAAEVARRSRRELGYDGLAQKNGFRTPEALVQSVTGSTRADAVTLVRVGTMVADTVAADQLAGADADDDSIGLSSVDEVNWHATVARAVEAGTVSFAQAEAIRNGLGEPSATVTGGILADAAAILVSAATDPGMPLTVDELRKLARQLRDSIDAEGLLDQETTQQDAQFIKAWRRADGMVGGSLLLDRENGAYVLSILDELTSPRRGGPRFVDTAERERAQAVLDDPRSTERIAVDGVMQLLRIGVNADPDTVFTTRKPAVRIVVTQETLNGEPDTDNRGVILDTGESVSVSTIERAICDAGSVTVTVDPDRKPLDVGRDRRLFTGRQKLALAIRDGGCIMRGCDRPPSWTEAHHIDHYGEHHGQTNIDDGVLLCRHHHLLLHNLHWRILRIDGRYFLRRSRSEEPDQQLTELHSKNPLTRERMAREHAGRQRAG